MFPSSRFGMKSLSEFFRRLGIGLQAGVDIRKLLAREAERGTLGKRRSALEELSAAIDQGDTMKVAMDRTGDAFPPLAREMVALGEQTGTLDAVLLRLADHYDHMLSLRQTFFVGIFWPLLQLLMALAALGLLIFVLGYIEPDPMFPIHDVVLGLRGMRGLIEYVIFLGAIVATAWFLISQWAQGKLGAKAVIAGLHRVPQLGSCLRTMSLSRMAWTLSLTTDTPMDALESVRTSLRATSNPLYQGLQSSIIGRMKKGDPLHVALRSTHEFPNDFVDAVEVGEETGELSESLYKLSRRYEENAKVAARIFVVVGSLAIWALVATFLIFMIFRVALTYTNMINEMSQPGWK